MNKPFDRNLYIENDNIAKEISVEFLIQKLGCILKQPLNEQKEQYKKYDYVIWYNESAIKVEVERKKVWTVSGSWQGYNTIDIPKRKEASEANVFIMTNNQCDTIVVIDMRDVLQSPYSSKNTIYTNKEWFFNVPLSKCMFFTKENDTWVKIK